LLTMKVAIERMLPTSLVQQGKGLMPRLTIHMHGECAQRRIPAVPGRFDPPAQVRYYVIDRIPGPSDLYTGLEVAVFEHYRLRI